jgi:hypothetical protein
MMKTVIPASATTPTAIPAPVSPLLSLPVGFGLNVATGLRGMLEGDADLWCRKPGFDGACADGDAVAELGCGDAVV